MRALSRLIATVAGVGYCPAGPGTLASAIAVAAWWYAPLPWPAHVLIGAALVAAGVWAADEEERTTGQTDPSCIVIDEVAAMWLVLAGLPKLWPVALAAFAAFRLFDIVKLGPVRRLERLPGGLGVMGDDLGAAAMARLLITLLLPMLCSV